jgi:hypothetical protein
MSYLLIIDGDEDSPRPAKLAKQFNLVVPGVEIYWGYSNKMGYEYGYYRANDDVFRSQSLPAEAAKLALWHYRDKLHHFDIEPIVTVGFGGKGSEPNSHPNICYHIVDELELAKPLDIKELWNWACNSERAGINLPKLISSNDLALLSLQILCQLYVELYADINLQIDKENFKNIKNLWMSTFNTLENLQRSLAKHTQDKNNIIAKLIESISQLQSIEEVNTWTVTDRQVMQQLCLQCLKISIK